MGGLQDTHLLCHIPYVHVKLCTKVGRWDEGGTAGLSIDLSLVAWTVLDTLHFKLLLDVFGDTPLHGDRIHPTHIFV